MSNVRTITLMLAGSVAVAAAGASLLTPDVAAQGSGLGFLATGSCYRVAFPIDSPPNYKVLEVLEGGWIRAEVDAGTSKAERPAIWINTAQIISMRQVPCSA